MLQFISYIIAVSLLFIFVMQGVWLPYSLGLGFLGGILSLFIFARYYRRAVLQNTLTMIDAEALFHDSRVQEALLLEKRRVRNALFWDKMIPKLSMVLPVYISLISKCLETRRVTEAREWIGKMEKYAGKKSFRLMYYFRVMAASLAGDLEAIKRDSETLRDLLDPAKEEDRGYLAQLTFLEARWALRQNDVQRAQKLTEEAHDLQPEMDNYYIMKSKIALAQGDLVAAQNYAHSLATTRLDKEDLSPIASLKQIIPYLENNIPQFGDQLEKLNSVIESDKSKHQALGIYQQLEVAIFSRDVTLLEQTIRDLEAIEWDHPSIKMRVEAAAAVFFAWRPEPRIERELMERVEKQLESEALSDEDIVSNALLLAIAHAEARDASDVTRLLERALSNPQAKQSVDTQHLGSLLKWYAARPTDSPAPNQDWLNKGRQLSEQPEAETFRGYWSVILSANPAATPTPENT